jgi:hypothetical protein
MWINAGRMHKIAANPRPACLYFNARQFNAIPLWGLSTGRRTSAASSELSVEEASVPETAREHALQYRIKLPGFICTQITHRNIFDAGLA